MQKACERKGELTTFPPIERESSSETTILSDLPEELIKAIFSFLSLPD